MNKQYIDKLIDERSKLHPDDPTIQNYWKKLTLELGKDEQETVKYLEQCEKQEIYWISEVFEDISEKFQSKEFIDFLKILQIKFIDLDLECDIKYAELAIK